MIKGWHELIVLWHPHKRLLWARSYDTSTPARQFYSRAFYCKLGNEVKVDDVKGGFMDANRARNQRLRDGYVELLTLQIDFGRDLAHNAVSVYASLVNFNLKGVSDIQSMSDIQCFVLKAVKSHFGSDAALEACHRIAQARPSGDMGAWVVDALKSADSFQAINQIQSGLSGRGCYF